MHFVSCSRKCSAMTPAEELQPGVLLSMNTSKISDLCPDSTQILCNHPRGREVSILMCSILWVLPVWEICVRSFCCDCFFFLFYLHFPWSLDYFDLVLDKNIGTARACFNFSPPSFPKKYNHFVCYCLRENKLLFHVELES